MKIKDLFEAIAPVGTTSNPVAPNGIAPTTTPSPTQPGAAAVSGNTAALADPKMQAAQLAKQKQEKDKQRQALQAQIAALQKQMADLNKTV